MANEVSTQSPRPREAVTVYDPVPVLDTAKFEHMQRIAKIMAASSLIPETLRTTGTKNAKEDLPFEQIFANCFLVVNQAVRWGMDPFAVISCCSVVYGRLMYEGKLVAAVLEAKLGVRLNYRWNDATTGDNLRVVVNATGPDGRLIKDENGKLKEIEGSVGEWKTTGQGTPWNGKQDRKMLAYRGAREWARLYEPGTMLGVYSDDEMTDLAENARFERARLVNRVEGVSDPLGTSAPKATKTESADRPKVATNETKSSDAEKAPAKEQGTVAPIHGAGIETAEERAPAKDAEPGPSGSASEEMSDDLPEEGENLLAEDDPPKTPKTEAEYKAYLLSYLAKATSASVVDSDWKAERKLRTEVNITQEVLDELKVAVGARIKELKAKAEVTG